MRWLVLVGTIVAGTACLRTPAHRCDANADCATDLCYIEFGAGDGLCVRSDTGCDSQLRYADDAGSLAGSCVGDPGGGGDGGFPGYEPCLRQRAIPVQDACTVAVCMAQPRCCNDEWGQECIQLAEKSCDAHCGQIAALVGLDQLHVTRWTGDDFQAFWSADIVGHKLNAVAWGDYDGDLRPDLATCDNGKSTGDAIRVWHNQLDAFELVKAAVTGGQCNDIDWIDVDDDGDLDLVAGTTYLGLDWVENDNGLFAEVEDLAGEENLAAIDWAYLDGDGRPDHLLGRYEQTLVARGSAGAGTGFVDLHETADTRRWKSISWGDVDGDGDLDILGTGDDIARVIVNTSDIGFTADPTPLFEEVDAGHDISASGFLDVDRDGDLDLVLFEESGPARVLRNETAGGGSGFTATPSWTSGTTPFTAAEDLDLAFGDADGNGTTDLIVCGQPDYCRMWLGDGIGGFTAEWDPGGANVVSDVEVTQEWE